MDSDRSILLRACAFTVVMVIACGKLVTLPSHLITKSAMKFCCEIAHTPSSQAWGHITVTAEVHNLCFRIMRANFCKSIFSLLKRLCNIKYCYSQTYSRTNKVGKGCFSVFQPSRSSMFFCHYSEWMSCSIYACWEDMQSNLVRILLTVVFIAFICLA